MRNRLRSALRASPHFSMVLSPSFLAASCASARESPVVGGMGMWISNGVSGLEVGGAGRVRECCKEERTGLTCCFFFGSEMGR